MELWPGGFPGELSSRDDNWQGDEEEGQTDPNDGVVSHESKSSGASIKKADGSEMACCQYQADRENAAPEDHRDLW